MSVLHTVIGLSSVKMYLVSCFDVVTVSRTLWWHFILVLQNVTSVYFIYLLLTKERIKF